MNINQVRYFLDIAETGSLNRSAMNLYISPQGLSRAIAQLEKGLGFDLFLRSNRGMVLTDEGLAFLKPAAEIWKAYRCFGHEVSLLSSNSPSWNNESLDLQVPPLLTVSDSLGEMLGVINEVYPSLRIDVTECNSYDIVSYAQALDNDSLRRTCMVATVPEYRISSYLNDSRFTITKLCEVAMAVRVNKNHPFACRQSVSRSEVARERIVCFNEPVMEDIVHHLLDEFGEPDFAFMGSIRNLLGRFPEAVAISGIYPGYTPSENIVTVPIQNTIVVHLVAITADPEPPLIRGVVGCLEKVYRKNIV